jgi:hypothetical protein
VLITERVLAPKSMKSMKKYRLLLAGLLGLPFFVVPGRVQAQAPPGPLPQVQSQDPPAVVKPAPPPVKPRTSILGGWKLNQEDSDDPRQRMQQAHGSSDSGRSRGGMGGGYPGGIGGRGGYGGRPRGGESDDDRAKMQEFVAPANTLSLAQKDAEVDVTDDQYRKLSIFTDGRKLQKSKDTASQEIAAHWNDKALVTDEKNPRGGKMSRTYELSPDGTQLYETLHLTVGRDNKSVGIRYVYDQVSSPAVKASAPATDTTKH